jgi:hypothetical protein
MIQYLYWHSIGSAETNFGGPSFDFMLTGDGTPANCHTVNTAGCFRATGVGINYTGTCTEDATPCSTNSGSPISGLTTGTALDSNEVASGGTASVPSNGIALGVFGTDNTNVFIGQSGSPAGTVSDGCSTVAGPPLCSTNLIQENANSSINAGLALFDQIVINAGSVGPFIGTLPNNDFGDNVVQAIGIIPK